jgi:hypothetical protein
MLCTVALMLAMAAAPCAGLEPGRSIWPPLNEQATPDNIDGWYFPVPPVSLSARPRAPAAASDITCWGQVV